MTNSPFFVDNLCQQSSQFLLSRPHLGFNARVALDLLKREGLKLSTAIDYGCGAGRFSVMLARALPDVQVLGLDLDHAAIEFARGLAVEARVESRCRFEVVDLTIHKPKVTYDLACFFAVRELFASEVELALAGRKLTRQGGYWLVDGSWLVQEHQLRDLDRRVERFVEVVGNLGGQLVASRDVIRSFDFDTALASLSSQRVPPKQIAAQGVVSEPEVEAAQRRLLSGIEGLTKSTVAASWLWLFRFGGPASDLDQSRRRSELRGVL